MNLPEEKTLPNQPTLQLAQLEHLTGAKLLADQFKRELGFVNRAILQKAIEARELLVALSAATTAPEVVGLLHFYVRRDEIVTLYSIVVAPNYRSTGLGQRLFQALVQEARNRGKTRINLKCPTELKANLFYERLGLEILRVEPGKLRPLNVWSYNFERQI